MSTGQDRTKIACHMVKPLSRPERIVPSLVTNGGLVSACAGTEPITAGSPGLPGSSFSDEDRATRAPEHRSEGGKRVGPTQRSLSEARAIAVSRIVMIQKRATIRCSGQPDMCRW